jgi:phosphotransferase system enzyme I (PtsI)
MAGDPAFTEVLLAMGLRSFSMHPVQVSAIKQIVLRTDSRRLRGLVRESFESEDVWDGCEKLREMVADRTTRQI